MKLPDWTKSAAAICKRYGKVAVPVIAVAAYEGYNYYFTAPAPSRPEIAASDFLSQVDEGRVDYIILRNDGRNTEIKGEYKNNEGLFATSLPTPMLPSLVPDLRKNRVEFLNDKSEPQSLFDALFYEIQAALLFSILGGQKMLMRLGLGKKLTLHERDTGVKFGDVAGIDEAKGELMEIVDFLKNPKRYTRVGAKIPKGVLLSGPPGTGKTLLARAVAGEAKVRFFSISGSDFVEMYVGLGARRVREMFTTANKKAPCIVFIDELDALGGNRAERTGGGGNDEHNQTLNQLLVGMDGISANKGIIIIGATNLPETLDRALLRPGRFDRKVVVPLPDARGREEILEIHTGGFSLNQDVRLSVIANNTPGFSGADLANLANEAALSAARLDKDNIGMADFEIAKDRIILGLARRSMILTDEQRKLTAFHEAGHALVALREDGCSSLDKVTIIPHGNSLGLTVSNHEDQSNVTLKQCKAKLVCLYGGREAERIIFGGDNITSGAAGDIQAATKLARQMVEQFGMSEKLGAVDLGGNEALSNDTVREIDLEVRNMTGKAQKRAANILEENRGELYAIAEALLARDTLSGAEIKALVRRPLNGVALG